MINDYFDNVYCINVDSRTDRWADCEKEFSKYNLLVERVSAFTPSDINFSVGIKGGEAALTTTHKKILEDAKEKGYNNILILEDDVEFAESINECLSEIPDNWDIVYFGGNHHFGQPIPITDSISIANKTLAMHCVAINSTIYDRMLEKINYLAPIDVIYADNLYLFNSYVFVPSKAWQRPSWSDLMQQHVDYGFLK
jgi:GR25 family glycosyltransferase involved in LPS biosynthesis